MSSTQTRADELREAKHPVYSDRALRLGTFGTNLQQGAAITSIDGALEATWPQTLEVSRTADRMGFDALVSVGRWRGFGGRTDFNGAGFEPFTWAAGIGGATGARGSSRRRTCRRSTRSSRRSRA
jgi:dimethylsulfone monooxygenase